MSFLSSASNFIKRNGIVYALHKAALRSGERYLRTYHKWALLNAPDKAELQRQGETRFPMQPKISIVVPVYNTKPRYLYELADSVLAQTYPHFELILLDGNSACPETALALAALKQRDARIFLHRSEENLGISGNTNLAIEKASGDYIALLDHDDLITPDALFEVVSAINATNADMLYSDEDKIDESSGTLFAPHFKPDFAPDTLRGCNYICHLMVLKKSLLQTAGGLNSAFDGSQDHDLALRASEIANRIHHIPKVLYHWRSLKTSMSRQNLEKCLDAGLRAVQAQVDRQGHPAKATAEGGRIQLRYIPDCRTSVTFIIEHHGSDEKLHQCLSHLGEPPFSNVSVIVLSKSCIDPYETVIYEPGASRFQMLNVCAKRAPGEVLVFLDSGMKVVDDQELPYLIGRALLPDAGVVAPTVLYPNGTIRHQGYVLGVEGIVKNPLQRQHIRNWRYYALGPIAHNVAAASVAFFAVRKAALMKAGLFNPWYQHDLGDVDLCLKLSAMGLYHVVLPTCKSVYHSRDKGPDAIIDENIQIKDAAGFLEAYGDLRDPFYNPNLSQTGRLYNLR